jgi:hypothetical protein
MKRIFLFISIGIILLAIPLTVLLVGKNQEVRKRAAPATTLSLSPSSMTKKVNDTFTVEIKIDTADNQIATIQLHIMYDPVKLQAIDITNGPLAPRITASGKVDTSGVASITVGARDNTSPITGIGTVAILTMKAISSSATPVSIKFAPHPDTYANALGEGENNVIIGSTAASVIITNADGTQATADFSTTDTSTSSATNFLPTNENASGSGQLPSASPSAVTITSLTENENVLTQTPLIQGKGAPGSTITVVIHSNSQQTVTVTVDANGNWSYTPTDPLAPGPHTIEAISSNSTTGQTYTVTRSIVVSTGNETENAASGSAIPATGAIQTTIIFIIVGTLFILSGAMLPVFVR